MPSKHSLFVAAACAFPLSLAACGSSSSNGDTQPVPEGAHYGYVVSGISLPMSSTDFALDLGSMTSSKLDHVVENKLGGLIGLVSAMSSSTSGGIQGTVNKAVATGQILLLVDFQTQDLANSSAAGFSVKLGVLATAMPQPCTDPSDTVCGRHLGGNGMFTVDASSPTDGVVSGKIVGGAFTGGPGDVTVQLALGGTTPIMLSLMRARIQATISPTGIMNATIGGLLTQSEIATELVPVVLGQVNPILSQSCTPVQGQPCSCTGLAAEVLIPADTNHDCQLSADEFLAYNPVQTALAPDVCTTNSCTKPDGVSIGLQVQAVKAAFPGVM